MVDIIVNFKIKNVLDFEDKKQFESSVIDALKEIAQKNEMDLISWGVI